MENVPNTRQPHIGLGGAGPAHFTALDEAQHLVCAPGVNNWGLSRGSGSVRANHHERILRVRSYKAARSSSSGAGALVRRSSCFSYRRSNTPSILLQHRDKGLDGNLWIFAKSIVCVFLLPYRTHSFGEMHRGKHDGESSPACPFFEKRFLSLSLPVHLQKLGQAVFRVKSGFIY